MKPLSILATIVLGLASLGFVVWVGQYRANGLLDTTKKEDTSAVTVDDLPLPKSGPYGKAEIAEKEFEFGTKRVGANDKHTFNIKNVGEGPLQLKLGKPSCQCTVGEVTKAGDASRGAYGPDEEIVIAPNESVNILVKWVMKTALEKFRQTVPIVTTDPDQRDIELVVSGVVDDPIHILPGPQWELGDMSHTEPSKAEGTIYSVVFDKFELVEEPRPNGYVKLILEPADADTLEKYDAKSGYRVKIEVGPNVPIGMFRENIKLTVVTDDNKSEPVANEGAATNEKPKTEGDDEGDTKNTVRYIVVNGRRTGPIELRGVDSGSKLNMASNRLVLGNFPASEGKKATLTVFVKGFDEELVLKSVEPADTPIKVRVVGPGKMLGKSKSYQLEVEVPPGPPGKHVEDHPVHIDLKTNHPDAPDFKLLLDYNATR